MNILMKNNVLKKLGITLLTIMIPYCVFSQSITVKGTVTDNNNESLIGVTIKEVGTNNGTITDINGNFEIKVSPNSSLSFSYIGYKNKTVKVGNQRIINVVMEPDILGLEEVVVVGYGQMKRSDLTGSVVSVGTEAIQNLFLLPLIRYFRDVQQEYRCSKLRECPEPVLLSAFEESIR